MKNLITSLKLSDWLVIIGIGALVMFTYHNLFANKIFSPSDFCEGLMMLLFGHGSHKGVNKYLDNKFTGDEEVK